MITRLIVGSVVGVTALISLLSLNTINDGKSLRERIQERNSPTASSTAPVAADFLSDLYTKSDSTVRLSDSQYHIQRDIAYGADAEEKFDLYRGLTVAQGTKSPLILMVHGGGWKRGDKALGAAITNKVNYFVPRGYAVISTNYPVDDIDPQLEVRSLAKAMTYIQQHADELGIDTSHIVLMGHSAGAHLVSLLTADVDERVAAQVKPWKGTISLDSAAYDVPSVMMRRHAKLYDDAFGTDATFWNLVSPLHQYTEKAEPLLLVCSSTRADDSCGMANSFSTKILSVGGKAEVLPYAYTHGEINSNVGVAGDYTNKIQAFLTSIGMP